MTRPTSRRLPGRLLPLAAASLLACGGESGTAANLGGPPPSEKACAVLRAGVALPDDLVESSGLVPSVRTPGVFWTHNDSGGEPSITAVDSAGRALGRVRIADARNRDWEDLATGPCGDGACVYAADVGDNSGGHDEIYLYRTPEPLPSDTIATAELLAARFPDGARDTEAVFALPDGSLYLVTKGRRSAIELFRWPAPSAPGETVTLQRVRELAPSPHSSADRATGAAASPDGRWVAVRTYVAVAFYRTADLLAGGPPALTMDLRPLRERQGEAVALSGAGRVTLTTEGAPDGTPPAALTHLQCPLQ
jgi:hypothetical protein